MGEYENAGMILLRMVVIFTTALLVVRKMGNRTVGQLSPFDFVLMVGIGDIVASVAMQKSDSLFNGFEALFALLLLQQLLAWLALKSTTLRKWFEGTPIELIEDGRIIKENFRKTQFNYDDLRQELHKLGMDMNNLKDIRLARLESCGEFTVVKSPDTEPMTKRDFAAFVASCDDNPLSPQGQKWHRIEQALDDIHFMADFFRNQQPGNLSSEEKRHES